MARLRDALPENVPGDFFVDESCIDCDTCRQVAPEVFEQSQGEQAYVYHQPSSAPERLRALMALVACPTSSIGTLSKDDTRAAAQKFPEKITEDVYYCGYTSESSFGASSYLIRRPSGNVLVDSPRAAGPLLGRIEALGGVRTLFLTHRDDVADHQKLAQKFGCERILHREDISSGTRSVERQIEGSAPERLADDLLIIPTPGHTRGSAVLLYRQKILFSGDHLWWSRHRQGLHASRGVCWYSWREQTRSMEKLLSFDFSLLLPGHGRRYQAPSIEAMRKELTELVAWMRTQ